MFVFKELLKDKIFKYHLLLAIISTLIVFNPISIYLINEFMPLYFLNRINFIFSNFILIGIVLFILFNKFGFKEKSLKLLLIFFYVNIHYSVLI